MRVCQLGWIVASPLVDHRLGGFAVQHRICQLGLVASLMVYRRLGGVAVQHRICQLGLVASLMVYRRLGGVAVQHRICQLGLVASLMVYRRLGGVADQRRALPCLVRTSRIATLPPSQRTCALPEDCILMDRLLSGFATL